MVTAQAARLVLAVSPGACLHRCITPRDTVSIKFLFTAGRSPDSWVAYHRTGRLPAPEAQWQSGPSCGMDSQNRSHTHLPLRGQCRDCRGWWPGTHQLPD